MKEIAASTPRKKRNAPRIGAVSNKFVLKDSCVSMEFAVAGSVQTNNAKRLVPYPISNKSFDRETVSGIELSGMLLIGTGLALLSLFNWRQQRAG